MGANDWKERLGVVYSTNSDYDYTTEQNEASETVDPNKQKLLVWLDKKQRAGKRVSIIRGFEGSDDHLKELAKLLKGKLGVGGSTKEGEIIIQGDLRDKIVEILKKEGYNAKKAGGN